MSACLHLLLERWGGKRCLLVCCYIRHYNNNYFSYISCPCRFPCILYHITTNTSSIQHFPFFLPTKRKTIYTPLGSGRRWKMWSAIDTLFFFVVSCLHCWVTWTMFLRLSSSLTRMVCDVSVTLALLYTYDMTHNDMHVLVSIFLLTMILPLTLQYRWYKSTCTFFVGVLSLLYFKYLSEWQAVQSWLDIIRTFFVQSFSPILQRICLTFMRVNLLCAFEWWIMY